MNVYKIFTKNLGFDKLLVRYFHIRLRESSRLVSMKQFLTILSAKYKDLVVI